MTDLPIGLSAYRMATVALAPFAPVLLRQRLLRGKEDGARIGPDTGIEPGLRRRGTTVIGRRCRVEPGGVITDCVIGDDAHIKAGSVLAESTLGDHCAIGPMAHLRPGTALAGHNQLGQFVETQTGGLGEKHQPSHPNHLRAP